jgi:hypothetical protein
MSLTKPYDNCKTYATDKSLFKIGHEASSVIP